MKWGGVGTENETFGKLIGNRLGPVSPGRSRELSKCIIRKHRELESTAHPKSAQQRRLLSTLLGPACKGDYAC